MVKRSWCKGRELPKQQGGNWKWKVASSEILMLVIISAKKRVMIPKDRSPFELPSLQTAQQQLDIAGLYVGEA